MSAALLGGCVCGRGEEEEGQGWKEIKCELPTGVCVCVGCKGSLQVRLALA